MAETEFRLHPRLDEDSEVIGDLALSRLLLSKDANFPWAILVPRRADIREIHQLSPDEQHQLTDEISLVSSVIEKHFEADKMNVAALGNMVPQLHVHIIARFTDDLGWPGPIWGKVPPIDYDDIALSRRLDALRDLIPALKHPI